MCLSSLNSTVSVEMPSASVFSLNIVHGDKSENGSGSGFYKGPHLTE